MWQGGGVDDTLKRTSVTDSSFLHHVRRSCQIFFFCETGPGSIRGETSLKGAASQHALQSDVLTPERIESFLERPEPSLHSVLAYPNSHTDTYTEYTRTGGSTGGFRMGGRLLKCNIYM
ncbi:hypothetical protein FQA47_004261 [Oryzias melastigma]|uniref:Uncharacterized protein n=1 Tax=Oryzias melastigma TaxID=30732 RepID=A0A834CNB1_ORYME|nr:hypothetical protein FQA47_004261 [Oryzias melastigma]